ncbi:hypothetical protein NP233_g1832 [Leucocoprinus birnbaumii]|uniref:Uncharacterized protein n=1 Tax=Leucocoprinus birnbaumii TaxID=56174 RepID=A0AAD5VZU1_9AGAR|nr:hypothetical protein NP233_g1832 [Leucocoprinus birnbaumii]
MQALRSTRSRIYALARSVPPSRFQWASPPRPYNPPRDPRAWPFRLWCRPNGTPRSKWKGVLYVTVIGGNVIIYREFPHKAVIKLYTVGELVNIQRLDATFSSYDLTKTRDLASYSSKLLLSNPIGYPHSNMALGEEEKEQQSRTLKKVAETLLEEIPGARVVFRDKLEEIHKMITQNPALSPLERSQKINDVMIGLASEIVRETCDTLKIISAKEVGEKSSGEGNWLTSLRHTNMLSLTRKTTLRMYRGSTAVALRWFIHLSYHPLLGPYTWRARLRYHPDGTPRSRWVLKAGLTLIMGGFSAALWIVAAAFLESQLDDMNLLSEMMILDANYSTYDSSKQEDLRSYFADVFTCLGHHTAFNPQLDQDFLRGFDALLDHVPPFRLLLRKEMELIHKHLVAVSVMPPQEAASSIVQGLTEMLTRLKDFSQEALNQNLGILDEDDGKGGRVEDEPIVEPYTWRARLWYRPNGTPRSKWKGVFYTAVTALAVLLLVNSLQEAVDEIYLLSLLVQMQRIDAKYPQYDLSKPSDVLSYLSEIVKHLPADEKREDVDVFNQLVERLMEISPELHGRLRGELEKLHNLLQDATQDPLDTAEAVLQALTDLSGHLVEIWQKAQGVNFEAQGIKKSDGEGTYEVVG